MSTTQTQAGHGDPRIEVTVLGQEGDEATVRINPNQPCSALLREGLRELYGSPGPNPDDYDLVLNGTVVEPLSRKVEEAGIGNGTTVSILPKTISRGAA